MVAEVLIGLKLVNESCKAIRSLIKLNEATDVGMLGDHIEGLLKANLKLKNRLTLLHLSGDRLWARQQATSFCLWRSRKLLKSDSAMSS